ncbi:MAG: hypothetical protein AAB074_09110 [Planctomycetota bacterium]
MRFFFIFALVSATAWSEPAATTRPVQAPEPDFAGAGESVPVEIEKDGYKAKLSWFPAVPKPGDLVRYRLAITIPGGAAPALLVRATMTKTAPGDAYDLLPKSEVPPEATPQDGRYVFTQTIFVPGTYRLTIDADDLEAGRSLKFEFAPATIGTSSSNALAYGIGIAGLALIVILIAFGLRRPAAE